MTNENRKEFRAALLAWFREFARDMPWRRTRDPYGIWVSEVMLQQTTVKTVTSRWPRFMERFPNATALAEAPQEEVLREWSGLGYYARARNMHRAAGVIAKEFGGELPDHYHLLLSLPGMGVYTAAAVASIAFDEPVAVVDANVDRVISRLDCIEDNIKQSSVKKHIRERANELLDPSAPGDFNQAMMELGAMICIPNAPLCRMCPVSKFCVAREQEKERSLPNLGPKKDFDSVIECCVSIRRKKQVLLLKRPPSVSFGGMWELPRVRCDVEETINDCAVRAVKQLTGMELTVKGPVLRLKHTVMNSRITLYVFESALTGGAIKLTAHEEARWCSADEWLALPLSTTQKKVAAALCDSEVSTKSGRKRSSKATDDLFQSVDDDEA